MRSLYIVLWMLPAIVPAQEALRKPALPEPKNLKVLKGQSPEQLIDTMRAFRTALNVQCNYCHVAGDFASDQNSKKEEARHMITMTREINTKLPQDAKAGRVTCYTCHHGATTPLTAPPPEKEGQGRDASRP